MSAGRLFGTDGIRGRAGQSPLTEPEVSAIGRAIAEVLGRERPAADAPPRVLLGHDGRRSGPGLLDALARGFAAAGWTPESMGLTTTPGLALCGRLEAYDAALMISASHNPAHDNGLKVFQSSGEKLPDSIEDAIQACYEGAPAPIEAGVSLAAREELGQRYLDYLLEKADGLSLGGMRVVLDCANGGGSALGPELLRRLGAEVHAIAHDPDGDNINQGCGATQLELLCETVRAQGAELGIALDGDGDRCMLADERGRVVDGDGILTVCALHARAEGSMQDPRIVATIMSNKGLHRALRSVGVSIVTTGVGDRRVVEALKSEGLGLGGEQSGHVVFGPDLFHIGDGLYTALRVLEVVRSTGQPLSSLVSPYQTFPQILLNVEVREKPELSDLTRLSERARAIEEELGDDGRVLLRYSGTEPLARVMVEGPEQELIRGHAEELAEILRQEIGVQPA